MKHLITAAAMALTCWNSLAFAGTPPTSVPSRGFQLECTDLCLVPPPAADGACYSPSSARFWSTCSELPRDPKCLADAQKYLTNCRVSDSLFSCVLQVTATYGRTVCASIPGDSGGYDLSSAAPIAPVSPIGVISGAVAGGVVGGASTEPTPVPIGPGGIG